MRALEAWMVSREGIVRVLMGAWSGMREREISQRCHKDFEEDDAIIQIALHVRKRQAFCEEMHTERWQDALFKYAGTSHQLNG